MTIYTDNINRPQEIVESKNDENFESILSGLKTLLAILLENIKNKEDSKSMACANFLKASIQYLNIAISNYNGLVQILAFCARNLFELHLWIRYVQLSKDNFKRWCDEAQKDKADILNSLINHINDISPHEDDIFKKELEILEEKNKHIMDIMRSSELSKNARINEIAEAVNKKNEYNVFFKIFSKYLHPTSFLVNSSPEEIQALGISNMLLVHIHLYASDIYNNISKFVKTI